MNQWVCKLKGRNRQPKTIHTHHLCCFFNIDDLVKWSFDVVQSLSCVHLLATPWTAAHQSSQSYTISQSLLKLMFIESVMPSNYLALCQPFSSCLHRKGSKRNSIFNFQPFYSWKFWLLLVTCDFISNPNLLSPAFSVGDSSWYGKISIIQVKRGKEESCITQESD